MLSINFRVDWDERCLDDVLSLTMTMAVDGCGADGNGCGARRQCVRKRTRRTQQRGSYGYEIGFVGDSIIMAGLAKPGQGLGIFRPPA